MSKPTYEDLERRVAHLSQECLKYSLAFHSTPNLMLLTSLEDGCIVEVNDAFVAAVGYGREELIGFTTTDLDLWADPTQRDRIVSALQQGGAVRNIEVQVRTRSGAPRVVLFSGEIVGLGDRPHLVSVASDITERRLAHEERDRLNAIIEATSDMVSTATPDGRLTYLNRAGRRLLGWDPDADLTGQRIGDAHPRWALDVVEREGIPAAIRDGLWQGTTALQVHDGSELPTSQVIMSHRDTNGELAYLSTVIRDISRQRQAEMALRQARLKLEDRVQERTAELANANARLQREIAERRQAEEQLQLFRVFVEASADGMGWADLEGIIRYANPSLCRMLDGCQDEVLGTPVQERYAEETRKRLQDEIFPQVLAQGSWVGEMELHSLEGRVSPTANSLFVLRSAEGEPTMFANVVTDLTERKRVEAELHSYHEHLEEIVAARTAALRDSEQRYRLISENASDVIWTSDLSLRCNYISPSVRQLRGLGPEEAMAQQPKDYIAPASLAALNEALATELAQAQRHGSAPARARTLELEMYHKDGSSVWVEMTMSLLHAAEQRPTGILGISRNITERKRMERERVRLEEELRHSQKMEAIGRLAGGIAHDFNNILTAISGYAEMVQLGLGTNDPLHDDVGEIGKAAARAAVLTNQLLTFSRKQVTEPRVIQLEDVISRAEKMLRRIIGEDIEMTIVRGAPLWPIKSDPGQIDQILVNLAVNSRDAMTSGGRLTIETRNVTVSALAPFAEATAGDYVMLAVSDTGHGMDEETEKHIFEPFFTTKPTGEGTGLGLSTVYGLVRQNNGLIQATSSPGRGARFEMVFPRVSEAAVEAAPPTPREVPGGTETVLVVEDDPMVRRLARRILEGKGYRVLDASEGGAACLLSEKHEGEIPLLVSDVVMPQMSGFELYERLREQRPKLKALFMSGYTETAPPLEPIRGTDFIAKPFTVDTLWSKVRDLLGRRPTEPDERGGDLS